jgi:2-dehydropantoate 2-reductase
MRILVMGTGGLGGYFGGLLQRAGEEVIFVARGAHLRALQSTGLRVKSPDGDFALPVHATDRGGEAGPVDLVLFAVKTYDVETAAEALRPAVGPETAILCLQNGVETEDRLGAMYGRGHVLGGVTYVSAVIEAPGVIAHTGPTGDIVFGEMDGRSTPRARAIETMLAGAGVETEMTGEILRRLWEKFVFICANAGMTATTRVSVGEVLAHAESHTMYRGLMEETAAVGVAKDIPLDGVVGRQMAVAEQLVRGRGFDTRSSLYNDLAAGRRMELDALCGAVVRMGRERGVPTPLNFAVVAVLRPHERKAAAAHAG